MRSDPGFRGSGSRTPSPGAGDVPETGWSGPDWAPFRGPEPEEDDIWVEAPDEDALLEPLDDNSEVWNEPDWAEPEHSGPGWAGPGAVSLEPAAAETARAPRRQAGRRGLRGLFGAHATDEERRDPAPSRLAYKMERLWLRPGLRRLVRIGLPMAACAMAASWYFSDETRRAEVESYVVTTRDWVQQRPEFMVEMLAVDGASPELTQAVREATRADLPLSSFDLDLDRMRADIEALSAVREAQLRVRPGGVLQIEVSEREPAMVWRSRKGLSLLDSEGVRIAGIEERGDWPALPLIAGDGANDAVTEAMNLVAAAQPLQERFRGLVRMGERRWDVVLDRGQRIMLPETQPAQVLERLIALDEAHKILERAVTRVDLRDPARPTLRVAAASIDQLRAIMAGSIQKVSE
ncbi:cell division protein FtsQ/DivIB [Roseicyclus sp. F158]|uniref:Cell division protein FtsQ n=1 Tax=Tropicimonas omnivorans TaxID=3075590 RepID=A0ABU3DGI6_9RHOB|nr:cell division protein FtsQ/DivIB [Roseicyclus sp. F158]MDT0682818.1 cell division protein FtsQ/DivIB [Roseicyclus sp. F158]